VGILIVIVLTVGFRWLLVDVSANVFLLGLAGASG